MKLTATELKYKSGIEELGDWFAENAKVPLVTGDCTGLLGLVVTVVLPELSFLVIYFSR